MIQIDGSFGEGGGQIIRTSVSLSAITGLPVEVWNVRAGRAKPGLQPQHLAAVKAAAEICGAELDGASVGSTRFAFTPKYEVRPGDYSFNIGTAGSTTLVAQTVLVPLALTGQPCTVSISGGTHNPMAPPSDYLERVYASALMEMGVSVKVETPRAGFFPEGGGRLEIEITGAPVLHPVRKIERGALRWLVAIVTTANVRESVFYRAREVLEARLDGVRVKHEEKPSSGAGAAVVVIADHEGGSAGFTGLGARGKPMEAVAEEAIASYLEWRELSAAVDEHLADQLVLPALFALDESSWTTPVVTEHLRTVLWVAHQFVPIKYEVGETVRLRLA